MNMTLEAIQTAYDKAGIKVNRIARTRLNDGYFVYHDFAMAKKTYKPLKFIKINPNGSKLYQRQHGVIRRDWIADDDQDMLEMQIQEALIRRNG